MQNVKLDMLAEALRQAEEFQDKYFPLWKESSLVFSTNALAGEVGELTEKLWTTSARLCELSKHQAGGGSNHRDVEMSQVLEECADVFLYTSLIVLKTGHSAEDFFGAVVAKIHKNGKRLDKLMPPPYSVEAGGC